MAYTTHKIDSNVWESVFESCGARMSDKKQSKGLTQTSISRIKNAPTKKQ